MKKKYNVAFAPLNERLLILSFNISKLLIKKGISVCILKTSLNGSELYAFKNKSLVKKISDIIPIVNVPYLQFKNKVGFFGNILRTIRVHYQLNSKWEAPYEVLVTFMDDYSVDEVLTIYSKKKTSQLLCFKKDLSQEEINIVFLYMIFFHFFEI